MRSISCLLFCAVALASVGALSAETLVCPSHIERRTSNYWVDHYNVDGWWASPYGGKRYIAFQRAFISNATCRGENHGPQTGVTKCLICEYEVKLQIERPAPPGRLCTVSGSNFICLSPSDLKSKGLKTTRPDRKK